MKYCVILLLTLVSCAPQVSTKHDILDSKKRDAWCPADKSKVPGKYGPYEEACSRISNKHAADYDVEKLAYKQP